MKHVYCTTYYTTNNKEAQRAAASPAVWLCTGSSYLITDDVRKTI